MYTIEQLKALTQDDLTQYSGAAENGGALYLYLSVEYADADDYAQRIDITRDISEVEEVDTPEFYAAWDSHWDDMYAEYLEAVADTTRTVPERIRASREAAGYTQREVGELCGYSGPQVQVLVAQWESGRRPVPMDKIKRLAQVLRIAPEKLLP